MFGSDAPGDLGGRGLRQARWYRLAGQRAALAQLLGVVEAPVGVFAADPQPGGQHIGEVLGTQLNCGTVADQLADQPVLDDRLASAQRLQPGQHFQHFRIRQRVERQAGDGIERGLEPGQGTKYRVAIRNQRRTHTPNTSSTHRQNPSI